MQNNTEKHSVNYQITFFKFIRRFSYAGLFSNMKLTGLLV